MVKYLSNLFHVFFFSMIILGCGEENFSEEQWKIIYRHNSDGETLAGEKEALIQAVRNGYPIRLGFGGRRPNDTLKSVEHVVDAQFLTIANGKEVFAQITPIFGQRPNLDSDTISIKLNHENNWTMLIGTNGERSTLSKQFDLEKQKESNQSTRGATWYARVPSNFSSNSSIPLWD